MDEDQNPGRWRLLRDVLAFQFKLLLDGLRDILLSPISIGAAMWGLFTSSTDPGKYFYRLLKLGHRSDRWINLFSTYDDDDVDRSQTSDAFVRKAESIVLGELEKGGVVSNIKHTAERAFDRIPSAASSLSAETAPDAELLAGLKPKTSGDKNPDAN
jgi:hypothetical protein